MSKNSSGSKITPSGGTVNVSIEIGTGSPFSNH
jgi:hypothetical protein